MKLLVVILTFVHCLQTNVQNMIELCASDKLSSCLFLQKQNGKFCDADLVFGSTRLPVHSCIIGSASCYVNRILESRDTRVMVPKLDIEVPINLTQCLWKDNQFCQDCAEKVIDFMYFQRIYVNEDHVPHIYSLGNVLEIPELLKLCNSLKVTADSLQNNSGDCLTADSNPTTKTDSILSCKAQCKDDSESVCKVMEKSVSDLNSASNQSCLDLGWTVSDSDNLICPKCKDSFTNVFMLQQHCNTHFGKFYVCHMCSFSTIKVLDLLKHLKDANHMETVCSLCLYETDTNAMLKEHLNEHDHPQPFFCRTCMTRFQTRTALNSHIVKHSTETPFVCSVCGRGFKWKQGLQSHMYIHTSIKNHLCDQCGYSTAHLKSFQDHKMIHSGKKFKCPVSTCQFTSVRKESVKHHQLTHSKEKPYQCEICGQAFSQAKNLRRHATTHDPNADPTNCPFCSFKTMRSDKLQEHFRKCHKDTENVLPIKSTKTKVNTVLWTKSGEESSKTVPKKTQALKPREKKKLTTRKLKNSAKLTTTTVQTPVISVSSNNSDSGKKCDEIPCGQLFPFLLDKETVIANSPVNVSNFILTTPDGGLVTLTQDQANLLVCNADGTLSVDVQAGDISLVNGQTADSVPLTEIPSAFDEIDKPILIQIQNEETVRSGVGVSCLSDQTILSLPEESNSENYVYGPTEVMEMDQTHIDAEPMVFLASTDSGELCVPLAYTDLTNEGTLAAKLSLT